MLIIPKLDWLCAQAEKMLIFWGDFLKIGHLKTHLNPMLVNLSPYENVNKLGYIPFSDTPG